MKLHEIHNLRALAEEDIEVKAAADIWKDADAAGSPKTYILNTIYVVKKADGLDEYEVNTDDGEKRTLVGKLSKAKLDAQFIPLRPNQKPDVEGYTQYRDINEVEAFKNDQDTIKVDLGTGTMSKLMKGDYLVRKSDQNKFTYEVVKAKNFESTYTEK